MNLNKKVNVLMAAAEAHLSICQFMSDAYLHRYGYQFYPFHNTADLAFWSVIKSSQKVENAPFKLLYAGRIGYGVEHTLLALSLVIEKMGETGVNLQLEIQTKDEQHPLVKKLKNFNHVQVTGTISYDQLPAKFSSAGGLVIPCDFDPMGIRFIRYSMPTKVSEYMAVGTPILVIGPPDTALVDYARQGWAKVCPTLNEDAIKEAIMSLINSDETRNQLVRTAQKLVKQNHDERHNVRVFRKLISDLTNKQGIDSNKLIMAQYE